MIKELICTFDSMLCISTSGGAVGLRFPAVEPHKAKWAAGSTASAAIQSDALPVGMGTETHWSGMKNRNCEILIYFYEME